MEESGYLFLRPEWIKLPRAQSVQDAAALLHYHQLKVNVLVIHIGDGKAGETVLDS